MAFRGRAAGSHFSNRFSARTETQPRQSSYPPIDRGELILSKQYFRLMQSTHHLAILEKCQIEKSVPVGMQRKVESLSSFIKPAAPGPWIIERVKQNTVKWIETNLLDLAEHYNRVMEGIFLGLEPYSVAAFDRAFKWARNRYRRKLDLGRIDTLKDRLLQTRVLPPVDEPDQQQWPALPQRVQKSHPSVTKKKSQSPPPRIEQEVSTRHVKQHILTSSQLVVHPAPPSDAGFLVHPLDTVTPEVESCPRASPPLPIAYNTNHTAKIHPLSFPRARADARGAVALGGAGERGPGEPRMAGGNNMRRRSYPTQELSFEDASESEPSRPGPLDPPSLSLPLGPRLSAADADPGTECFNISTTPSTDLSLTSVTPSLPRGFFPRRPPQPASGPSVAVIAMGPNPDISQTHSRQARLTSMSSPGLQPPSPSDQPGGRVNRLSLKGNSLRQTPVQEPLRHINSNRKASDWHIRIRKPQVILGDSNLSKIPSFRDENLQIDSFPGANMDHLNELMRKLVKPDITVKVLILSVGLNNCHNRNQEATLKKCLLKLLKQAESSFPCASVHIPLLNIHTSFDRVQQASIRGFNELVVQKARFLSEISPLRFQTQGDGVHWTPSTARQILEHWRDQLNC